jgi:hypothetical protein
MWLSAALPGHWSRVGGAIDYRLDVARESFFINYIYQNLSAGNVTSYNVTGFATATATIPRTPSPTAATDLL